MTKSFVDRLVLLHADEEGQGLVEYLLILALVAFAVTAGMAAWLVTSTSLSVRLVRC